MELTVYSITAFTLCATLVLFAYWQYKAALTESANLEKREQELLNPMKGEQELTNSMDTCTRRELMEIISQKITERDATRKALKIMRLKVVHLQQTKNVPLLSLELQDLAAMVAGNDQEAIMKYIYDEDK